MKKTIGQIAYEGSCHRASTLNLLVKPTPWDALPKEAKICWEFAAQRVRVAIANAIAHGEAL